MNNLADEILVQLLINKEQKIESLVRLLATTTNRVLEAINDINHTFEENTVVIQKNTCLLSDSLIDTIYEYVKKEHYLTIPVEVRVELLSIAILVGMKNDSLNNLADLVKVSRNTVLRDLNKAREKFNLKSCDIAYSRNCGYVAEGTEITLRKILIESLTAIVEIPIGDKLLFEAELSHETEVVFLKKRFQKIEQRLNIIFSDEMIEVLPYTTYGIVQRVKNNGKIWEFSKRIKEITTTKEYRIIESVFWNYQFLKKDDLIYLILLVLSSNLINSESDFYDNEELNHAVSLFISNIENKLAIQFSNHDHLKKTLLQHIKPALYRAELGIKVINPLSNKFINEYRSIFILVQKEMNLFEQFTRTTFSNDEIAFIAMIVLSHLMSFSNARSDKPFKAIVICKSGTSISSMLIEALKDLFPYVSFKGVYSVRQFESSDIESDFIFSTLPLRTDREVLIVPSYMQYEEKQELKEKVNKTIEENTILKAKSILAFLDSYLKDEKEKEALNKLSEFLKQNDEPEVIHEKNEELIISSEQLSIIKDKVLWEDVIQHSFGPLLKRKSVTEEYVLKCKDSFRDSYQTMLIGPDVLLPHVEPVYGAIRMDAQINIFKNPVIAPNNEAYNIIVALAPGKAHEHVNWLMEMNEGFVSGNLKEKLLSAKSEKEAFQLLEGRTIHELC